MAKEIEFEKDTIVPKVNLNVEPGDQEPEIKDALETISDSFIMKEERDGKNEKIQLLFEQGFEVSDPTGTRKISSKKLYQAFWRTANRMKPLDFTIHGLGRDENHERIVTDGVSTTMDRGGYLSALRDKGGAFQNLLMYGDSFIMVGTNPDKKGVPIVFNPISNSNLYVDVFANGLRNRGYGRNATKAVAVFSYSWAEACDLFKEYDFQEIAGIGEIPRGKSEKETDRDIEQDEARREVTEIAFAYNLNKPAFSVFAGTACTPLNILQGDDYPFWKDGEPYIPISQFMCMPSSEGFYNHGIGDMIYDLAVISRQLLNMEVGHVIDNTWPIELVNLPKGEAAKFFNKLGLAYEMRAQGKHGYVAIEHDVDAPGSATVNSQTLLTQNLVEEWKLIYDTLDLELKRMGINLDELDRAGNVTATEILSDEENSNSFVKQIMEYNASETQFMVELTMDFIKKFINKGNKTPLNLTTKVQLQNGEARMDGVTLGMVADELKKNHYFVRVNSRTGAIPSNLMRQARIMRLLPAAPPGTPAYEKLMTQFAQLNDIDIEGGEFLQQQAPMPAGEIPSQGELPPGLDQPIASATDRMTMNPRAKEQQMAL